MIARTETKNAQNESSLQAYETSDVVTGVIAFDNQTGFNDADCTARDGKVFSFDDARVEQGKEHPNYTLSVGRRMSLTHWRHRRLRCSTYSQS